MHRSVSVKGGSGPTLEPGDCSARTHPATASSLGQSDGDRASARPVWPQPKPRMRRAGRSISTNIVEDFSHLSRVVPCAGTREANRCCSLLSRMRVENLKTQRVRASATYHRAGRRNNQAASSLVVARVPASARPLQHCGSRPVRQRTSSYLGRAEPPRVGRDADEEREQKP
jgi:hypothetical protein